MSIRVYAALASTYVKRFCMIGPSLLMTCGGWKSDLISRRAAKRIGGRRSGSRRTMPIDMSTSAKYSSKTFRETRVWSPCFCQSSLGL